MTQVTLGSVPNKTTTNQQPIQLGNVAANPFAIDTSTGSFFAGTLTGSAHLEFQNVTATSEWAVQLTQDATGHALFLDGAGGAVITLLCGIPTPPSLGGAVVIPQGPGEKFTLYFRGVGVGLALLVDIEVPGPQI